MRTDAGSVVGSISIDTVTVQYVIVGFFGRGRTSSGGP